MDGYVFFEVDNMGNPIYGDKMKELLNCEKEHILFILSAEYQANFSVELIDHKVIIIPEDVLKKWIMLFVKFVGIQVKMLM